MTSTDYSTAHWSMTRHAAASDYGEDAYTLFPHMAIIKGIDAATARLIEAAPKMLDALRQAQRALNTAPRFRVGDTDSYKIAAVVDKAIAKATAANHQSSIKETMYERWNRDSDETTQRAQVTCENAIAQARAAIAEAEAPSVASPPVSPPIVTVTLRGGLIDDIDASIPAHVIVEDWDIEDDDSGRKPARNVWTLAGTLPAGKAAMLRRLIAND